MAKLIYIPRQSQKSNPNPSQKRIYRTVFMKKTAFVTHHMTDAKEHSALVLFVCGGKTNKIDT